MKIDIKDGSGKTISKIDLPVQFGEQIRVDLIKRAVLAGQANARQAYGAKIGAGMRQKGKLSRRRRDYKTSYGHGIARTPRKIMSRNGTRMYWVGAVAPNTVGGRQAHPPKATKEWSQKINIKERRKAIRSALSAVMDSNFVSKRGHKIPEGYPFGLDTSIQQIDKTAKVVALLESLGFDKELDRSSERKIRPGKGKIRGRKYVTPIGPLLVVGQGCPLTKAAAGIPGVSVKPVNELSAELLAPGCAPGRLTLFTQEALEQLAQKNLYV